MSIEAEALRGIISDLVARLKPDNIVDKLYEAKLLTQAEYESLISREMKLDVRDVNRRILLAVSKGPEGSVVTFAEIVKSNDQSELAGEILRGKNLVIPLAEFNFGINLWRQSPFTAVVLSSFSLIGDSMRTVSSLCILTTAHVKASSAQTGRPQSRSVSTSAAITLTREEVAMKHTRDDGGSDATQSCSPLPSSNKPFLSTFEASDPITSSTVWTVLSLCPLTYNTMQASTLSVLEISCLVMPRHTQGVPDPLPLHTHIYRSSRIW